MCHGMRFHATGSRGDLSTHLHIDLLTEILDAGIEHLPLRRVVAYKDSIGQQERVLYKKE